MDTSETPKKKRFPIGKILFRGSLAIVAVLLGAHFIFINSGSGEWELVEEYEGATIYSQKTPGSALKKFKGTIRLKSNLSRFVMMAQEGQNITEDTGFYDGRDIDRDNTQIYHSTFKTALPLPLVKPREYVIRNHFFQHPVTKAVYYEVAAVPDKIPADDCCFRVTSMNNYWVFTPLGNGELELEWFINMDMGLPYFLVNNIQPDYMFFMLLQTQELLDREEFKLAHKNSDYDWIDDVEADFIEKLEQGLASTDADNI